jgi:hypothetical protein
MSIRLLCNIHSVMQERTSVNSFDPWQKYRKTAGLPKLIKRFAEKVANIKEDGCLFLIIM